MPSTATARSSPSAPIPDPPLAAPGPACHHGPQRRTPRDGGDEMASTGRLVFTNANLVDGEHPAKPGVTVVVEGERITSVGTGQRNDLTAADRVVDLAGRTLMPGMVTCHYHSTYHELGSFPAPYGLEHAARVPGAARREEPRVGVAVRLHRRGECRRAPRDRLGDEARHRRGPRARPALRAVGARAQHHRARQRQLALLLGRARGGRGPALRRPRRVPPRGARRGQARRRDHQAVRHRRPRHHRPEGPARDDARGVHRRGRDRALTQRADPRSHREQAGHPDGARGRDGRHRPRRRPRRRVHRSRRRERAPSSRRASTSPPRSSS